MIRMLVTCCLLAAAAGAPQYGSYKGRNRNSIIQRSVLPRKFEVTKPVQRYQGSGGEEGYKGGAGGYQGGAGGGYQSGAGGYQGGAAEGYQGGAGGYGLKKGQYGGSDNYNAQPANYDFAYEVSAPEYQLQYGHQESRRDMTARGSYRVLLPDGRTQIVEYVADEEGYKPTVTYQEAATGYGGSGGYGGQQGGYGGQQGGYGGQQGGYSGQQGGYQQNNGGYGSKKSGGGKGAYGQKSSRYSQNQGYSNQVQGYQQNGRSQY